MKAGLLTRSPETNAFPVAFLRHVAGVSTFPRRQSRQPVARLFAPEGLHTAAGLSGIPTRFPVGHHRVNLHALAKVLQTSEITKKAKAFLPFGGFPSAALPYSKVLQTSGMAKEKDEVFSPLPFPSAALPYLKVLQTSILLEPWRSSWSGSSSPTGEAMVLFGSSLPPQKKKEDVLLGSFDEFTRSGTGMFYVLERRMLKKTKRGKLVRKDNSAENSRRPSGRRQPAGLGVIHGLLPCQVRHSARPSVAFCKAKHRLRPCHPWSFAPRRAAWGHRRPPSTRAGHKKGGACWLLLHGKDTKSAPRFQTGHQTS